MKDLARIRRVMRGTTGVILAADAVLSVALAGAVAAGRFLVQDSAGAGLREPAAAVVRAETTHVTAADVEKITMGKALFRTSASAVKEKVVDELAHYELKGISTRRGVRQAHVRDTKLKKLMTKRVGDTLGAYEIVEISNAGVTVRRGSETVVLSKG